MSDLRTKITEDMKQAMKAKDALTLGTLRLVNASLKDKDIEIRVAGTGSVSDGDVLTVLQKMLKQREESSKTFRENDRAELADKEDSEIEVINRYMPKQIEGAELEAIIAEAVKESGAESPRDMGKVMGVLKSKYAGQINMGSVSGLVKGILG
ncbi:MAG: glutamyl-tRNA amidotransferase [Alphaproteobacteria bacterium]|nr:MAG: glutamyl-tRNA amidotransferase [Alphaproteobacteria bacterium]